MRTMKKLFLAGLLGLVCMTPLQAQTKAEADSAYAAGKYEDAISVYTALLKKGESADVYYNLGNCYYRTDRIARAVLNYERAALLDPGDSDIRFNLELARSKTIDKITPESEMFFITWYKNVVDWMGMDAWARTGVAAFVLACVLVLLYFLGNKVGWKKAGFFGALAMVVVAALATWVVPGGEYVERDGSMEFVPVASVPQSWQLMSALFEGFTRQAGIM